MCDVTKSALSQGTDLISQIGCIFSLINVLHERKNTHFYSLRYFFFDLPYFAILHYFKVLNLKFETCKNVCSKQNIKLLRLICFEFKLEFLKSYFFLKQNIYEFMNFSKLNCFKILS